MPRSPLTARRERIRGAIAKVAGGVRHLYPLRLRATIADYYRDRMRIPAIVNAQIGLT